MGMFRRVSSSMLATLVVVVAAGLSIGHGFSTSAPDWLSDTRPPPKAQSQEVISKVIDKILSGDDRDLFAAFTPPPEEPGPLALINASRYWQWQQTPISDSESEADRFLQEYQQEAVLVYSVSVESGWNYFTNLSESNRRRLIESDVLLSQFLKLTAQKAKRFNSEHFQNLTTKRLLRKLSIEGPNVMEEQDFHQLMATQSELSQIFANAAVCEPNQPPPCTLRLEPDLMQRMATSNDYRLLYYYWLAWQNDVGPQTKEKFFELVYLNNQAAQLNGFRDTGAMWKDAYETDDFDQQLESAYGEMKQLYSQIHAYIRRKLRSSYSQYIGASDPLPVHILGSMDGNSWINLYETTVPFRGKWNADPTPALYYQNYTAEKIYRRAEEFFVSLGFPRLSYQFWRDSLFSRPPDRDVLCMPTSVDFRNGRDFRVKVCAQVSADDFIAAHHQLAQIYYFMSYKDLPIPFRDGANPAAIDVVGSTLATLARSPDYLFSIGLLPFAENDTEAEINYLYRNALDRIVSMPFNLAIDKWRWSIFSGEFNQTNANREYWNLRLNYQGVTPPVDRTEQDFDAGAFLPVIQNTPSINLFVGYIVQFQLMKAMCIEANYQGPLHRCNVFQSTAAGQKLKTLMELGSSKPWPEVLQTLTGSPKLDIQPMLEYYRPLQQWLMSDNSKNGESIGWNITGAPRVAIIPLGGNGQKTFDYIDTISDSCLNGETCLPNSHCNGTHCVCEDGSLSHKCASVPSFESGDSFTLNIVQNKNGTKTEPGMNDKDGSGSASGSSESLTALFWLALACQLFHLLRQ